MTHVFCGFELLMFKKFHTCPEQWIELKETLIQKGDEADPEHLGKIPQSLWFLSVALHKRPDFLLQLIREENEREKKKQHRKPGVTLLWTYLNSHNFTEFHLDSIFKYGDDNKLPKEIFRCPNVKFLSLKYNCLENLPSDIGRMQQLEYLALTNNKLQVHSIPYTLTFCSKLRTILLDNNILDALPGFLLKMPSIKTVHRHGNHNYFKSTFMWYHTDVEFRIIPVSGTNTFGSGDPQSLQFWAAKAVIGSKIDFYKDPSVALVLKDYISDIYHLFRVCHFCASACLPDQIGYKVITFKNPYLGNTCVPFQHWACSIDCAKALEVPARMEQIQAALRLDSLYEEYVEECTQVFYNTRHSKAVCSCFTSRTSDYGPNLNKETLLAAPPNSPGARSPKNTQCAIS
ncbi:uncharacterized protein [Argopecten irradians]|uniref:uncharacterized protein n=1 Tax=Argopecten irradians TaxID=31199 RepID=UPI0037216AB8